MASASAAEEMTREDMDEATGTEFTQSRDIEVVSTFDEMGLNDDLLRGVYAYGFERPSAIQQRAIKPIISGRDVIAQSQSGTGKTAVFCIGALQVRFVRFDCMYRPGQRAGWKNGWIDGWQGRIDGTPYEDANRNRYFGRCPSRPHPVRLPGGIARPSMRRRPGLSAGSDSGGCTVAKAITQSEGSAISSSFLFLILHIAAWGGRERERERCLRSTERLTERIP